MLKGILTIGSLLLLSWSFIFPSPQKDQGKLISEKEMVEFFKPQIKSYAKKHVVPGFIKVTEKSYLDYNSNDQQDQLTNQK